METNDVLSSVEELLKEHKPVEVCERGKHFDKGIPAQWIVRFREGEMALCSNCIPLILHQELSDYDEFNFSRI